MDVNSAQFDFFQPKSGDKYFVDQVIDKYNNRVIIKGAVYRPGTFSIDEKGMTILLVEQYVDFVRKYGTSFQVMNRGRFVAKGEVAELDESMVKKHLSI